MCAVPNDLPAQLTDSGPGFEPADNSGLDLTLSRGQQLCPGRLHDAGDFTYPPLIPVVNLCLGGR